MNLVSLHNHINTTTATSRFTFIIFRLLAEFKREIFANELRLGSMHQQQEAEKEAGHQAYSQKNYCSH
ncbi:hypothetical protein [Pedobacter sp. CG_S7]|uniref:hypothetical protein n=1 Tax=Pedobacter sp. CG_S7 TaxID=3143930 RepID=UPI0033951278